MNESFEPIDEEENLKNEKEFLKNIMEFEKQFEEHKTIKALTR